jgi:hypothetical protein
VTTWKRIRPGFYRAGAYTVVQLQQMGCWQAVGPGLGDACWFARKDQAQDRVTQAASDRIIGKGNTCVVHCGDNVLVGDRKGHVASIMGGPVGDDKRRWTHDLRWVDPVSVGYEHVERFIYCLKFARGKRLCLFRHEFTVVTP